MAMIEAGAGTGNMWDENSGPITGIYIKKRSGVGKHGSNVYTLRPEGAIGTDKDTGVWGSTVIDSKFAEIPRGSLVSIEYIGMAAGKSYKDYKILYDPDTATAAAIAARDTANQAALNKPEPPKSDDVVITDLDADQKINLDDIPF